ncbi:MAG: zinc ribbon domain-containing protein [Gemmatimonadales bacterium]|jgi:putative FmdB family regulatory protein
MPTYHYVCPEGHDFERFEKKISDRSRRKCPECGKMATRQISGGAGLIFKGSGFYVTDYKQGGEAAKGGEEGTAKKDEAKKDASKAEATKPNDTKPKGKDS